VTSEGPSVARVPGRVWTSTVLLVAGRAFGTLCTVLVLALLARHLAGAEFGRFTFYLAVLLLLDVVADFGTSSAAIQRGAAGTQAFAGALAAARRIRLRAAGAGWLVVGAGALLAGEEGAAWIVVAALAPLSRVCELSAVAYQRAIRWRAPVVVRALTAAVRLATTAALVSAGVQGFGPYLLAHAVVGALGNVALHLVAARHLPPPAAALSLFATALPLAAASIAQLAYLYADNLVVRVLCGPVELGRYNAAVRVFSVAVLVAGYVTSVALPWLADRARAGGLGAATLRLSAPLVLLGVAILVALFPFADELVRLLYGPGFELAVPSLRWLLVAAVLVHAGAAPLTAVVASGRSHLVLAITGAGLVLNVALNLWLVPERGIEGAAIATTATEGAILLLSLLVLGLARPPRSASL
jgi:O-antigen/teichoic acid export membrane protein